MDQDFKVLPSYVITAENGQGKTWIGQPYTFGNAIAASDTADLQHETLEAFSHYTYQWYDKSRLETQFQGIHFT